jgi:hypothetical protein
LGVGLTTPPLKNITVTKTLKELMEEDHGGSQDPHSVLAPVKKIPYIIPGC